MWLRLHSGVNVIYLIFVSDFDKENCSCNFKFNQNKTLGDTEDEYEKCVRVI